MPISYNPQTQYRGDEYLYQGISGAGKALGAGVQDYLRKQQEAKQEMELQEKRDAQNRIILQHAQEKGLITPEQLKEFQFGNAKQRDGITAGVSATIATDLALKQRQFNMAPPMITRPQVAPGTDMGGVKPPLGIQQGSSFRPLPPPAQAPAVVDLPDAQGKPSGVKAVIDGSGNPQILPKEQQAQETYTPPQERLEFGKQMGLEWFPTSTKAGYWVKDPKAPTNNQTKPLTFEDFLDTAQKAKTLIDAKGLTQDSYDTITDILTGQLKRMSGRGPAETRTLSDADQKALDWALANPNDTRSAAIRAKLGIR